jgi:hypothetical protein
MSKEATIQDVLEAVHTLATHMDERFVEVHEKIETQGRELRAEITIQGKELREEMRSMGQELRSASDAGIAALNSRCGRMEHFMSRVARKLDMEFQPS